MTDLKRGDLVAHVTNRSWPWMVMAEMQTKKWLCSTVTAYVGRYEATFHPDELVPYRPVKSVADGLTFAFEEAVAGQEFEVSAVLRDVREKVAKMMGLEEAK